MPRRENTRERWQHVERAMDDGRELGAIQVYKMGSLYFVIDGNHRVSVSRSQEREYIDAHVIEIDVDEDIRSTAEARAITRRQL
jgi:hypothetical protein